MHINSKMYNVTVLPTDVVDGLLTLTIDNVNLMSGTTYNVTVILSNGNDEVAILKNLSK